MLTLLCSVLLSQSFAMILSISDLSSSNFNIQNWESISNDGLIQPYQPLADQRCLITLFPLTANYVSYKKTYTITEEEFFLVYIEFEAYFIEFTPCVVTIVANSEEIYSKQITNQQLTPICGGQDVQLTFFVPFYSKSNIIHIQINYQQFTYKSDSYIGIRNLNIYNNGIPQTNGCPFAYPFVQTDGTCVSKCNNGCQFLSGPQLRFCTTDSNCSSKLLNTYAPETQVWQYNGTTPSIYEQNYLTQVNSKYYLFNNNEFTNVMKSSLFISQLGSGTNSYYTLQQPINQAFKIQVSFIFYIFGIWEDGSTVGMYMKGAGIYENIIVNISKSRNIYTSSTGSAFYSCNITNSFGQQQSILKTFITYQSNFYSSTITIGFAQILYKSQTASYGFGEINIYQADSDPNSSLIGIYGLPFQCNPPYFAYLGTCILNCPPYSIKIDRNCTDYLYTESQLINQSLKLSGWSGYIVKKYYDNNFFQQDILNDFKIFPLNYMNFKSGQSYSFVENKKILGGYNCWGSGTYNLQATSLRTHYQLRIYLKLYLIDDWQSQDTFQIYVDGNLIQSYHQTKTEQLQGTDQLDQKIDVSLAIQHTQNSVSVLFVCSLILFDSSKSSCGISDLFVLMDKNSDLDCYKTNQFYSFLTGRCEKCDSSFSNCVFFPSYSPYTNKCKSGCVNCSNPSTCLACDSLSGLELIGGVCKCRIGFVVNGNVCNQCHYSCLTCSGQLESDCISPCSQTRLYQGGKCPCTLNYIDVYNQQACQLIVSTCHYSCDTCFGIQYYNCVTCPYNSFRQLVQTTFTSVCSCSESYEEQLQNTICRYILPCHFSCLTCNGGQQNNCLSCQLNFILNDNTCICPIIGFNQLNSLQSCNQNYNNCHYSCETCIDQTDIKCITCDLNINRQLFILNLDQFQFQCQCITGYYEFNNVCNKCDQSCLSCNHSGPNNCMSCDMNQFRILNNTNCVCLQGYNDYEERQQCKMNFQYCHDSCMSCYGPLMNNCLSCEQGIQQINGYCLCLQNQIDRENKKCIYCDSQIGIPIQECQYINLYDGIWTYGEQCCFNNVIQQSYGCTNIFQQPSLCFKCPDNCIQCQQQNDIINCLQCSDNYFNQLITCEQCNEFNCKVCSSPYQCVICYDNIIPINGICSISCKDTNEQDQNQYFQNISCQSRCGDGIRSFDEECDDANQLSLDGCSKECLIENNYYCSKQLHQQSICFISQLPSLLLYKVNSKYSDIQEFLIRTNQKVYTQNIILDIIIDQQNTSYYYQLQYQVFKQSEQLDFMAININLTFNESYQNLNLTFVITGQVLNEFNQNLSSNKISTIIENIVIMNEQEKSLSQSLQLIGKGITISLACVSASTILLGGTSQLIQFLGMIQQFRYIQYVNIQLPPNLYQFLEIFSGFTLSSIFDSFYFRSIIDSHINLPFNQPKQQKFQIFNINAIFLNNILTYIYVLLIQALIHLSLPLFIKFIQNIKQKILKCDTNLKFFLHRILSRLQKWLYNASLISFYYGFYLISLAFCYDNLFAILLQMTNQNFNSYYLIFNFILASLFILLFGQIIVYSPYDKELNNKNIWNAKFNTILILQSVLFQISIVIVQEFPQCQVIIISQTSLTISIFLIFLAPFQSKFINYTLMFQEISLFLVSVTFNVYIYFPLKTDHILLGWIHIGILIIMITINIALVFYSTLIQIRLLVK